MTEQEIEQHIDSIAAIGSPKAIAEMKLLLKNKMMEENNLGEATNLEWPTEQIKIPEGKKPIYKQCYSTTYCGCYCTGDCEEIDFFVDDYESLQMPTCQGDIKEQYVLYVIEMDRWREQQTGKEYSKSWQSRFKRLLQQDKQYDRMWHFKGKLITGEPYYSTDHWEDKTDGYVVTLQQGLQMGFKINIDKYGL